VARHTYLNSRLTVRLGNVARIDIQKERRFALSSSKRDSYSLFRERFDERAIIKVKPCPRVLTA
jgi:hypothetical protein